MICHSSISACVISHVTSFGSKDFNEAILSRSFSENDSASNSPIIVSVRSLPCRSHSKTYGTGLKYFISGPFNRSFKKLSKVAMPPPPGEIQEHGRQPRLGARLATSAHGCTQVRLWETARLEGGYTSTHLAHEGKDNEKSISCLPCLSSAYVHNHAIAVFWPAVGCGIS